MRTRRQLRLLTLVALGAVLAWSSVGCQPTLPPTVTPGPPPAATSDEDAVEIPINQGVEIDQVLTYTDPEGQFSIDIPSGWAEIRQPDEELSPDMKVGVVFQPAAANALLTVTQFDNGQVPQSVGATANSVLEMTGWPDQEGYREIARETPIGGEGASMRLEIEYTRGTGQTMHSLVLFQIDGTTFSMVHFGVEAPSWEANEGIIRDILETYRVPAVSQV